MAELYVLSYIEKTANRFPSTSFFGGAQIDFTVKSWPA